MRAVLDGFAADVAAETHANAGAASAVAGA